jgi:hypothetical protein
MFKILFVALLVSIIAFATQAQVIPTTNHETKSVINIGSEHVDMVTDYYYTYSSQTDSTFGRKKVLTFDAQDNKTGSSSFLWDAYSGKYINEEKDEFIYDANGNNTEYRYWYGDGDEWVKNTLVKKSFNADDRETQSIIFNFNPDNKTWDTISIEHNEYNTDGMIVVKYDSIKHSYNSPPWEIKRITHFYDANKNDTTIINSEWYASINDWGLRLKTCNKFDSENRLIESSSTDGVNYGNNLFYKYNADGYLDTVIGYRPIMSGGNLTWQLNFRSEYSYTTEGWISQISMWNKSTTEDKMENTRVTINTYNTNGDKTEVINKLNSKYNGLINNDKTVNEYDDDFNLIKEEYFTWFNNIKEWHLQTTKTKVYKGGLLRMATYQDANYNYPTNRDFYYYNGETPTLSPVQESDEAVVFPNPVRSSLNIQNPGLNYNQVMVVSVSGELVEQQVLTSTRTVLNLADVKAGSYIVVLQGNHDFKTFKIVKK